MPETFAQYLEKWLKQSTAQGLNNPLVKMPVKRFRLLQPTEFATIANGGSLTIGTMSDPISRNLYKNAQTRIRERGEHCAFICHGVVELIIAGGATQQPRTALFPVFLKRTSIQVAGDKIKALVSDDETWQFNPLLAAHLKDFGIQINPNSSERPEESVNLLKAQLSNRASQVRSDSYVGLFSSQQMVVQQRLTEPPLRQALARNPVIQAKIEGGKVSAVDLGEITDDGLEGLGIVLPCDDSQLRVVQSSSQGCCLQVEGPPGTGKSQTIANIISDALYHGRSSLLVCDKKAAIVQVEERLTNCGLKPAILNLHDEDLDKREFLRQATDKFQADRYTSGGVQSANYPFEQLQATRKTLNDRVKFGRTIAHPALQVTKRNALAGMIQLKKELKNVPNIAIANWQSLSKDRLGKLLNSLAEWPGLAEILSDSTNVWNKIRTETFDDNPNASNELQELANNVLEQIESLDKVREWAASVGIESPIQSDGEATNVLTLIEMVITKPSCHRKVDGNSEITLPELNRLEAAWNRREDLLAARHPVPLTEIYPSTAEQEAEKLFEVERTKTWEGLSQREAFHANWHAEISRGQDKYVRLCNQIGLVYSPLLKVRRAQLQAVLRLREFGGLIPRGWWSASTKPVLLVDGWAGKLRACMSHAKTAPVPVHFVALERVASTHWQHVEAMAEHGFNMVSYCVNYVDDRKCKYALRQAYPGIPVRGFKQWREVTLHATNAHNIMKSLRAASAVHNVLKQLTENYLATVHETGNDAQFINHKDVDRLRNAAGLVEQWRERNDLFEVNSPHWQTLWESPNPQGLLQAEILLSELDELTLPGNDSDNLEDALAYYEQARQGIRAFLSAYEKQDGDRTHLVIKSIAAQKEFALCQERLAPLAKYLELQDNEQIIPNWPWLHNVIKWRDTFKGLRGTQKLDVDSTLWVKLRDRLKAHREFMDDSYKTLDNFFDGCMSEIADYDSLKALLGQILVDLPRQSLWLEKKRWSKKIPAFPELKDLWGKILEGNVSPGHAERLFCFNLLRLCDPITRPQGPELKQTLNAFVQQDENLTSWILDHLKSKLRDSMQQAASTAAQSESELRRLSGMQRVRGTVRELVNAHLDYLLAAKTCWMMSPTSLANLIDSGIFESHGVPFDLVIFDEASQIRVLDGLLSMSFGKQVIVVGDKNQLPPTDFFAGFAYDDETDTQDFGISESMLDEFSGVFEDDKTHVMLMSHYRSETPDLIRFSNHHFYDEKLEMYPPARISGIGRRLHYVPNAIYSETAGQRNTRPKQKKS